MPALHDAEWDGLLNRTKRQIEEGRAIIADVKRNEPPLLHYAALWNDIKVMKTLIALGNNVNAKDKDQKTPLFYAELYDNAQAINLLKEAGAR